MRFNSRLLKLEQKKNIKSDVSKKFILVVGGFATLEGKKVQLDKLDASKYNPIEYRRIDIVLDETVSPHNAYAESLYRLENI